MKVLIRQHFRYINFTKKLFLKSILKKKLFKYSMQCMGFLRKHKPWILPGLWYKTPHNVTLLTTLFFRRLDFGALNKYCMNRVRSLLSMRCMRCMRARCWDKVQWIPGLKAVRLLQLARLWPSVYQLTDARTRTNIFDERKQDWPGLSCDLRFINKRMLALEKTSLTRENKID